MTDLQGVVARQRLSADECAAILELARLCNQHDSLAIKLNPGMLQRRSGESSDDFIFYDQEQIIGYIGMYRFKASEIEVSGMVHPQHRRRGVFRALYQAARRSCEERGIPEMLWICEHGSLSGAAFLATLGAQHRFSEYVMELDFAALPPAPADDLVIREATADDTPLIGHLMSSGFAMDAAEAQAFFESNLSRPDRNMYLVSTATAQIGVIGTHSSAEGAYMYGFVVVPELRGQGYGRRILLHTIHRLVAAGQRTISLEVATENASALGLYQSCGFRSTSANDYYALPLTQ